MNTIGISSDRFMYTYVLRACVVSECLSSSYRRGRRFMDIFCGTVCFKLVKLLLLWSRGGSFMGTSSEGVLIQSFQL
ncbi:hypothetical protein ACFX1X_040205 [Malus domestica]